MPISEHATDFDLHGLVAIRLVDASPGDLAAVGRQLGLSPCRTDREPDVTIRFVRRTDESPLRLLGRDDAGFDRDDFLVLRSRHRTGVRVRVPFEGIGGRCEIICDTGVPAVPLLIPVVNLTALAHGVVPLHASAFRYGGMGVVCTGWSKGGKTEALLAFMARGAEYVGDEWVYIPRDGRMMFGIPEPIRLWSWHLETLPEMRRRVGMRRRLRLGSIRGALGLANLTRSRSLDRLRVLLTRQLHVDVRPRDLFGDAACSMRGSFDRLVLVGSHTSPGVTVCPVDPRDVAVRMEHSLSFERQDFMGFYRMFRFAFPDRRNSFIEEADHLSREILLDAFSGKPAFDLRHPYPVAIPSLYDELWPALDASAPDARGAECAPRDSGRKSLVPAS